LHRGSADNKRLDAALDEISAEGLSDDDSETLRQIAADRYHDGRFTPRDQKNRVTMTQVVAMAAV